MILLFLFLLLIEESNFWKKDADHLILQILYKWIQMRRLEFRVNFNNQHLLGIEEMLKSNIRPF